MENKANETIKFLKKHYEKLKGKTKNKYFIVLYGPPASGKTRARDLSYEYLKEYFGEDNAKDSFIDVGIDEITLDQKIDNKSVGLLLKDNLHNIIPGIDKSKNPEELIKGKIETLARTSQDIYFENRKDYYSAILLYFAISIDRNIFLETTGFNIKYLNNIIKDVVFYSYIPIILYPFVNSVTELYNRSIMRGINEGRFFICPKLYEIAIKALKNFFIIKIESSEYLKIIYDSNVKSDNPIKYLVDYKITKKNEGKNITEIKIEKIDNYNSIVKINGECS